MSRLTQNRSFRRCSSQPFSQLITEETKLNTTKASSTRTKWPKQDERTHRRQNI